MPELSPPLRLPLELFIGRTKANGLTVRYTANRGYVHGKDFIQYVLDGSAGGTPAP